jgi:Neuraminidase (sialidase)
MQIDVTPTSPRLNSIYISSTEFDPSSNSIIAVAHSKNGGATWKNVMVDAAVFPVVDQFSDLGIGSDGTVYVSWMRCSATGPTGDCGGTTSMIMFSKSTDGGGTWSSPVTIAMANLAPDSCGAFYGCLPNTSERVSNVPAIDIDRTSGTFGGRLYSVMYNWNGNNLQVLVARSKNGGSTWSSPVKVAAGAPNDEFFPWLSTALNGTVGVTWLDRRLDSNNVNYDAFSTTSTDGGVTFAPSTRLSTVSSNPFNDGFGSGFMGDYTGNIWVGNRLFASWTDTRSGIGQDEVGALKI